MMAGGGGRLKTGGENNKCPPFSLVSIFYYLNKEDFMQSQIGTNYSKIS